MQRVAVEGLEDHLFGNKTEKWGQARHRGCSDYRNDQQRFLRPADSGEHAQVTCASFVVDDADHHEQSGFEQTVSQQHRRTSQSGVLGAQAVDHHQEAQLGDRAIGQNKLDIGLPQRAVRADNHGGQSQAQHQGKPER